jgi:hypothetical protein
MIWTGWNNGTKHSTGAGYGFKITAVERDLHFKPEWRCIAVELPTPSGQIVVDVEINKQAFWGDCRELISKEHRTMAVGSRLRTLGKGNATEICR